MLLVRLSLLLQNVTPSALIAFKLKNKFELKKSSGQFKILDKLFRPARELPRLEKSRQKPAY